MPLFCHLDSARNDRGYSARNDDSIVNTASFLYLNLWMNEMTLKQKMADFLKNKDQNLQVSEMFLIFALTFY